MPPKVDDYPVHPGDHGIMARYQSFNLSAGADAALEFLEALYVLHDEFEKVYKSYITLNKLLGCMFEENGVVFRDQDDLTDKEGDYLSYIIKNTEWLLPQIFDTMECQYVIVQQTTENPFRTFRKPSVPMLTRTGFIKFVLVNYLDRMARGDHRPHNILFAITEKYRLLVPGTARPVMPIDDRKQVEKNFRDLANELEIPLDRLVRQIRSFKAVPPNLPNPPLNTTTPTAAAAAATATSMKERRKSTGASGGFSKANTPSGEYPPSLQQYNPYTSSSRKYTPSLGSEATSRGGGGVGIGGGYEQPPASDYSRYRSDYSSKSYRRSPSPSPPQTSPRREREGYLKSAPSSPKRERERERGRELDRERDRDFYQRRSSPTYFSSPPPPAQPPRKSLAEIQREKEEMELRAAEQELKKLEARYERQAKEREFKNEMEYLEAQKRGLEAASRNIQEATERMRGTGLEEDYYYRYRYL